MSRKKYTKAFALLLAMSLTMGTPASVMAANEVPSETASEDTILNESEETVNV